MGKLTRQINNRFAGRVGTCKNATSRYKMLSPPHPLVGPKKIFSVLERVRDTKNRDIIINQSIRPTNAEIKGEQKNVPRTKFYSMYRWGPGLSAGVRKSGFYHHSKPSVFSIHRGKCYVKFYDLAKIFTN